MTKVLEALILMIKTLSQTCCDNCCDNVTSVTKGGNDIDLVLASEDRLLDYDIDRNDIKKMFEAFELYSSIHAENVIERQIDELSTMHRLCYLKADISRDIKHYYVQGTFPKKVYDRLNNQLQQKYNDIHDAWVVELVKDTDRRYFEKIEAFEKWKRIYNGAT